jgi:uncharacterized membrane protein
METHLRSWMKSFSWRIVGIVLLGGISYAFTKDWKQTTWITIIFHGIRTVLYYLHERWWERISWGRIKHPLSHLPVKRDLAPEDHEAIRNLLRERKCLSMQDYEI